MIVPVAFWGITMFALGITVGSFLTAVIYRLGQQALGLQTLSLLEPKRSMCPICRHSLGALDLIPLFSFLLAGQKCRYCKAPISWRYFGVELLTGLLFVSLFLHFPHTTMRDVPTLIAALAFGATLIPIFFIDLETYTIPISLTLLATVIPVARDIWGITHHEMGYELVWGWLPRSILGGLIGGLIFGFVRVSGWIYKGIEAMGLGDVYLARGMGAMLMISMPPALAAGWFFLWVILSCVTAIVVYPIDKAVRRKANAKKISLTGQKTLDRYGNTPAPVELTGKPGDNEDEQSEETLSWQREGTFGAQVRDIAEALFGYDALEWTRYTFDRKYRQRLEAEAVNLPDEEEWTPADTAIPFGPFLVVGFLLTLFFGPALLTAYFAYTHLFAPANTASVTQ